MLLKESPPFDNNDYYFELKLDGIRAVLYVQKGNISIKNKRGDQLISRYPELKEVWNDVADECVLDGELICTSNGQPDFSKLQKRALLSNPFKIKLMMKSCPVQFVAYDILQKGKTLLIEQPLYKRKEILEQTLKESSVLLKSRFIIGKGIEFFNLAKKQNLEGIVAKRIDSTYQLGKRSSQWLKIKALQDEDFLICGFKLNDSGQVKDILLARQITNSQSKQDNQKTYFEVQNKHYQYYGSVGIGISQQDSDFLIDFEKTHSISPPLNISNAHFVELKNYCTVVYMLETKSGKLRQPVFKGIRTDR